MKHSNKNSNTTYIGWHYIGSVFTLSYNHSHSNTYVTPDIIYFRNKYYVHKFVLIITNKIRI